MPKLLANGTSYLTSENDQLETILAAFCNANGISTNAALQTAIATITSVANNPGVNTTFLSYERERMKAMNYIVP